jgi:hypothetical protein
MPLLKVAVLVVWLSNADGSIVAHASGLAVDVPACEQLAANKIADESGNPDLDGSTPKYWCWNASTKIDPREQKRQPGSTVTRGVTLIEVRAVVSAAAGQVRGSPKVVVARGVVRRRATSRTHDANDHSV